MADILKGTINVLVSKDSDGLGTPLYKSLYPKTSTDQVQNLDTFVDNAIDNKILAIPDASATVRGLVSINANSNITNNSGNISINQNNIINALGYTPQNTKEQIASAAVAITANALTNIRNIDGVAFNGVNDVSHYAICDTASSTTVKQIACSGFVLDPGAQIIITFTNDNTATEPLLNVNETGAKGIKYRNVNITPGALGKNRTYQFVYDGMFYQLIGDLDTNDDTQLVKGVKGNNELSYRTGNINITPADIGLGNVNNTTDSIKNVNTARTLAEARTIAMTGAVTGTATAFDGSKDITISATSLDMNMAGAGILSVARGGTGQSTLSEVTVGKANKAVALETPRNINGMAFSGAGSVSNYGICETIAGEPEKLVRLPNFHKEEGAMVIVTFKNSNTADSPQLNVNFTGAATIQYRGEGITGNTLAAGRTYQFVYDGSCYQFIGDIDTNDTTQLITGIKGGAETHWRTGYVEITKEHIGLGNVVNKAEADLNVKSAENAKFALNDDIGNKITDTYLRTDAKAASATVADSAAKLTNARKINISDASGDNLGTAINFDGSQVEDHVIKLPTTIKANLTGIASDSSKLGGIDAANYATQTYVDEKINDVTEADTSELLETLRQIKGEIGEGGSLSTLLNTKQNASEALTSVTNNVSTTNKLLYTNGGTKYVTSDLTAFARELLSDDNATSMRNRLSALANDGTAVAAKKLKDITLINIKDKDNNKGSSTNFDGSQSEYTISLPDKIKADEFIGSLTGNADTASDSNKLGGIDAASYATQTYVDTKVSTILGADTSGLVDTLQQLKEDLGNADLTTLLQTKQDKSTILDDISKLSLTANQILYTDSDSKFRTTTLSTFAHDILDDINDTAVRKTIYAAKGLNDDYDTADRAKHDFNGAQIDTTYAKLESAQFTNGNLKITGTIAATTNDNTVATTKFVHDAIDTDNAKQATHLYVTTQSGTSNYASTNNGGTYLKLYDTDTLRESINIKGSGSISVTNDANGSITINGTDTNTDTKVTQNLATSSNAGTYPILASNTKDLNTTAAGTALFSTGIKMNPVNNTISAATFSGNLSGTADKATNDSDGKQISTTYAKLGGATFTGAVTLASTPAANDNSKKAATTAYVDRAISDLINSAPETLDTLAEIANAITNDQTGLEALMAAIGKKQDQHAALTSISGLTTTASQILYTTAKDTYTTTAITKIGRDILASTDAAAVRSTISAASTSDVTAIKKAIYIGPKSFTLSVTGTNWKEDTSETATEYKWKYELADTDITANDIANFNIQRENHQIANEAQLCPVNESFAGKVVLRAKSKPPGNISGHYYILKNTVVA